MRTTKFMVGMLILIFLISMVSALKINSVSTEPLEVAPGEIFRISIEVENIFEYDIENLKVGLNFQNVPFAPYQSSAEEFIDKLKDGDEEDFDFRVIALPDASSGIYKVPVNLEYEYNGTKVKNELISVTINSDPELRISSEDSILIKGKESSFSIRVTNSGLADVKFVYVSIGQMSGVDVFSEKEKYLGDIDSDDFDSVDYRVYISEDSPDKLSVPVHLEYKDATNKKFSENRILNVNIYSLEEAQRLGLVEKSNSSVYIIIAILVIAYIIYRIIRKRRKKKK